MSSGFLFFLYVTCVLGAYKLASAYLTRRENAKFAKASGCERPPNACSRWPLSTDLLLQAWRATQQSRIMDFFVRVCEQSGDTFKLSLLGAECVDTIAPENIEAILSSQFQSVRKPTFAPLLGSGIFTQDGHDWKHSRHLLRPQFDRRRFQQRFEGMEEHIGHLLPCLPEAGMVDLQPLFFRYTLDVTTSMLFGRSVGSLQETSSGEAGLRFADAFKTAQEYLHERSRLVNWYWLLDGLRFRRSIHVVHAWLDETIGQALKCRSTSDLEKVAVVTNKSEETVLDSLIRDTRDPKVLRDQLINVLLAGRDSTASCLSWTFLLLASHPAVLEKVRAEIASNFETGQQSRIPTREDISRLPYLEVVIKEVLRLYPPVPVNSREVLADTTLPVGGGSTQTSPVLLRKGEFVGYSVFAMHRRKDIYGPDADLFRPERWLVPDGEPYCLNKIGWAYLPFNGGPRACLGQEFASLMVSYVVVRILQEIPILRLPAGTVPDQSATLEHELTLILASANGCVVEVEKESEGCGAVPGTSRGGS